jgi:hypothetical protein
MAELGPHAIAPHDMMCFLPSRTGGVTSKVAFVSLCTGEVTNAIAMQGGFLNVCWPSHNTVTTKRGELLASYVSKIQHMFSLIFDCLGQFYTVLVANVTVRTCHLVLTSKPSCCQGSRQNLNLTNTVEYAF